MKNILKISIAALASAALLSGCIKETFPTDRATSDQLAGSASALEAMVKGIPTALIQVKSLTDYGTGISPSRPSTSLPIQQQATWP